MCIYFSKLPRTRDRNDDPRFDWVHGGDHDQQVRNVLLHRGGAPGRPRHARGPKCQPSGPPRNDRAHQVRVERFRSKWTVIRNVDDYVMLHSIGSDFRCFFWLVQIHDGVFDWFRLLRLLLTDSDPRSFIWLVQTFEVSVNWFRFTMLFDWFRLPMLQLIDSDIWGSFRLIQIHDASFDWLRSTMIDWFIRHSIR